MYGCTSTTLHNTTLHNTTLHIYHICVCTIPHSTVRHHITQYHTTCHSTTSQYTVPHNTTPHTTERHHIPQYLHCSSLSPNSTLPSLISHATLSLHCSLLTPNTGTHGTDPFGGQYVQYSVPKMCVTFMSDNIQNGSDTYRYNLHLIFERHCIWVVWDSRRLLRVCMSAATCTPLDTADWAERERWVRINKD